MTEESDYQLNSYFYTLPPELIASRPCIPRDHSKLMVYHQSTGLIEHKYFYEIGDYLSPQDLLVFNNSRVFPSRLFGEKSTGGQAELLLLDPNSKEDLYLVMLRSNGRKKTGDQFNFQGMKAEIVDTVDGGLFLMKFDLDAVAVHSHFQQFASLAIPPYIRQGISDEQDAVDYQTIFAKEQGSVAAPTAGLHFTSELLDKLRDGGVDQAEVTLNVGIGTFKPIEVENIVDHQMHSEFYSINKEVETKINSSGKNIVAVGTTTLRVLESYNQQLKRCGQTQLFLYPGKKVSAVGSLITNFHLPKSSLMLLVSSLIGREKLLELYALAVEKKYRFYSYGDAMLIIRSQNV